MNAPPPVSNLVGLTRRPSPADDISSKQTGSGLSHRSVGCSHETLGHRCLKRGSETWWPSCHVWPFVQLILPVHWEEGTDYSFGPLKEQSAHVEEKKKVSTFSSRQIYVQVEARGFKKIKIRSTSMYGKTTPKSSIMKPSRLDVPDGQCFLDVPNSLETKPQNQ